MEKNTWSILWLIFYGLMQLLQVVTLTTELENQVVMNLKLIALLNAMKWHWRKFIIDLGILLGNIGVVKTSNCSRQFNYELIYSAEYNCLPLSFGFLGGLFFIFIFLGSIYKKLRPYGVLFANPNYISLILIITWER